MFFQRQMTSLPAIGALLCAVSVFGMAPLGAAEEVFVVTPSTVPDHKAVFATIESRRVVPGRSRIGGTVAAIAVKEGDHVDLGQVIATVGDDKLALQM
jgi:multidrug efflux pump subunit AcrA (membrane-fusion protein)